MMSPEICWHSHWNVIGPSTSAGSEMKCYIYQTLIIDWIELNEGKILYYSLRYWMSCKTDMEMSAVLRDNCQQ